MSLSPLPKIYQKNRSFLTLHFLLKYRKPVPSAGKKFSLETMARRYTCGTLLSTYISSFSSLPSCPFAPNDLPFLVRDLERFRSRGQVESLFSYYVFLLSFHSNWYIPSRRSGSHLEFLSVHRLRCISFIYFFNMWHCCLLLSPINLFIFRCYCYLFSHLWPCVLPRSLTPWNLTLQLYVFET